MGNPIFHPTLYTPATTPVEKQLALINNEDPGNGVWRVVLCTEDSIREDEVDEALGTLRSVLEKAKHDSGVTAYVRVRNPEVMKRVLDLPGADKLQGFVIPKADPEHFPSYADQLVGTDFTLMPILESSNMFVPAYRASLYDVLRSYETVIECLRIGANDLMGHLGIRRAAVDFTVYDTPVGAVIHSIINEFRGGAARFTITAPVFELFGPRYDDLLRKEVAQHIMNGLFGQTVIHPRHIRTIRDLYKVSGEDLASATEILGNTKAVSGLNGRMDEYTTHWRWAQTIVERFNLFGTDTTSKTAADILV